MVEEELKAYIEMINSELQEPEFELINGQVCVHSTKKFLKANVNSVTEAAKMMNTSKQVEHIKSFLNGAQ